MTLQQIVNLDSEQRSKLLRGMKLVSPRKPRQCEHVKTNGEFCGSPALRGRNYCYFHLSYHGSRLRAEREHTRALANGGDTAVVPLELPPLEDAASIQMALMQVIDAILHNRIDSKRAGLVLYALQTASSNLARADFEQQHGATVAGGYDDFEQDFELGDDATELRRTDQPVEDEVSEHEARIAQIEEMAEAYSKLDAARNQAIDNLPKGEDSDGDSEDDPRSAFRCESLCQFLCELHGPGAEYSGAPAVHTVQREAMSQRIRLAPSVADENVKKMPKRKAA